MSDRASMRGACIRTTVAAVLLAGLGSGALQAAAPASRVQRIKLAGFKGFSDDRFWGKFGAPFSLVNLDRDPQLEVLVKEWRGWIYRNNRTITRPNTHPARLYAFDHDGRPLWAFDQGKGVNVGVNFGPAIAFDTDGDGVAEVYCRTADDPQGEWPKLVVKQGDRDWLVRLDPATGKVTARAPYPPHQGRPGASQLFVGYMDGEKPWIVASGGPEYGRQTVRAFDGDLKMQWQAEVVRHGAHVPFCADVDGDGKDEVVMGSAVLDHDGRLLWELDLGHVDLAVASDIVPSSPGLEILIGSQDKHFTGVVRGKDGKTLWSAKQKTHSQQGCGEFDLRRPGLECFGWQAKKDGYATNSINMWDAGGHTLPAAAYFRPMPGGKSSTVYGWWRGARMRTFPDASAGTPKPDFFYIIGDLAGDPLEEIAWLVRDEIVIHHAPGKARTGMPPLRKDRKYIVELARGSAYMTLTHWSRPMPAMLTSTAGR